MSEFSEHDSDFLQTLHRGQTITGTVTEIATFGVTFVDIGTYTAMINIPELSWRPLGHPSDIVAAGQTITTEILDVDLERGRVSLSLKALQRDPLIDLRRQVGSVVVGPSPRSFPSASLSASKTGPTVSRAWSPRPNSPTRIAHWMSETPSPWRSATWISSGVASSSPSPRAA
jgi:predicted RNA-binding protein with RPS1 domain